MKPTTRQRLTSKLVIVQATGCLEWQGWRQPSGHGQAYYNGRLMPAHRAFYMLETGVELTSKQHVCHHCDNPACCNVDHLFIGTAGDNMRDMVSKGRHASKRGTQNVPRGSKSPKSKLTDAQLYEIRMHLQSGFGPTEIFKTGRYPISVSGISKIKHNKCRITNV